MNRDEASRFTLYGFNYSIYTHSYLCYGQDEMLRRLAKQLIAVRGQPGGNCTLASSTSQGLLNACSKRHLQGLRAGPDPSEHGRQVWREAWGAPEGAAQGRPGSA